MELSIDTSTRYASTCLSQEGNLLAAFSWFSKQNHSVELLPSIDNLLTWQNLDNKALDYVIIVLGPGGFSALRVGLSTAKGLSSSLNIPLVALNTLEIEAYVFRGLGFQICSILEMGREEVAAAIYNGLDEGWSCIREGHISKVEDLCATINTKTVFCGEAVEKHGDLINQELGDLAIVAKQILPTRMPAIIAHMGYNKSRRMAFENLSTVEPIYLRRPSISQPRAVL